MVVMRIKMSRLMKKRCAFIRKRLYEITKARPEILLGETPIVIYATPWNEQLFEKIKKDISDIKIM